MLRFGKKGKLSPKFIGSYEITECISPLAYMLALSLELDRIYNIFYISFLRRYISKLSYAISIETIEVQPDLTYEEKPVKKYD